MRSFLPNLVGRATLHFLLPSGRSLPLFDVNASISLPPFFSRLLARKEIKFQPPPFHARCVPAAPFFPAKRHATKPEMREVKLIVVPSYTPHPFFVTRVLSRTSVGVRLFHAFPPLPAKKKELVLFSVFFCLVFIRGTV